MRLVINLIPPDWFLGASPGLQLRPALVTTRDAGSVGLNHYGWYLWVHNRFGGWLPEARVQDWATSSPSSFRDGHCARGGDAATSPS